VKVVGLTARGVSCAEAETLASTVAKQLSRTGSVSLPEAASLAMSSSAPCRSCAGTTDVKVLEPDGAEVTVTVRGKTKNLVGGAQLAVPPLTLPLPSVTWPMPIPLPTPVVPAPSSGGSGKMLV
jgi:hypothetical protein